MDRSDLTFRAVMKILRPWSLAANVVLYALGVGVAVYLGRPIDQVLYLVGQALIMLLMIAGLFLSAFFEAPATEELRRRLQKYSQESEPGEDQDLSWVIPRNSLLLVAISALTGGAALTVLLYARGVLNLTAFVFLGLGLALVFLYAVPPYRLSDTGYGELVAAIFLANLTPALAYVLQTGELHRLLPMLTFPLTALYIAMSLAISLQGYYKDLKSGHKTLMVQSGWQRGMVLHNIMILMAYFLVGLAAILGLPWSLTWPMLLTFPIGLFQFFQMWQISNGAPPRWRILRLTAAASFGLMAYLIVFALWVG
jgi:1,4-dihydroxy-2-naphthoate octaprenyltransferase